jgi:hypothetical protein
MRVQRFVKKKQQNATQVVDNSDFFAHCKAKNAKK